MVTEPRNGRTRRETATWAIGAGVASLITGWAGAVQVIQEPLSRDIAALARRIDDYTARADAWRVDFRGQMNVAITDALQRTDERRLGMLQHLNQVDAAYGSALGDLAARINRIEADRARLVENAIPRLQRIEDHLSAVDDRLVNVEKNFTHVLRGEATKPDRLGGPPYPTRDQ
jgi:hypothetical protein